MSDLVIEVTDSSFEHEILQSNLPVVLDFWAAWCGPCKALAPVLEKLAAEYDGKVKFAKMNVDDNPRTPDKFGVRGIPMLVFFKEGKVIDSVVGNQDREVIVELLKKFFDFLSSKYFETQIMKAVFFNEHGDSSQLQYGDLPEPQLQDGYALIKVKAVALNHLDIWVRRGWPGLKLNFPHIGGSDIAGELVAIKGAFSDRKFEPNSRVVVSPGVNTVVDEWTRRGEDSLSPGYKIIGEQLPGGMADYVVVPISNLIKIPDHLSFEEAAAPILVGVTSWRMLFKRGLLQAGETVLIVGSGGGVNSMSLLLAKAAGATVIVLAGGEEKAKRAAKLGADYVINYKSLPNWHLEVSKITAGRGVDLVIDNVGRATFEGSIRSVRRGGRIVTVGNTSGYEITFDNRLLFTKQISLIGSTMGSFQDLLDFLNFFWTRKMTPVIDRVAPLKDGPQMLKLLEIGEQFGKIVLSV